MGGRIDCEGHATKGCQVAKTMDLDRDTLIVHIGSRMPSLVLAGRRRQHLGVVVVLGCLGWPSCWQGWNGSALGSRNLYADMNKVLYLKYVW